MLEGLCLVSEHQHGPLVGLMFHTRVADVVIHFSGCWNRTLPSFEHSVLLSHTPGLSEDNSDSSFYDAHGKIVTTSIFSYCYAMA